MHTPEAIEEVVKQAEVFPSRDHQAAGRMVDMITVTYVHQRQRIGDINVLLWRNRHSRLTQRMAEKQKVV